MCFNKQKRTLFSLYLYPVVLQIRFSVWRNNVHVCCCELPKCAHSFFVISCCRTLQCVTWCCGTSCSMEQGQTVCVRDAMRHLRCWITACLGDALGWNGPRPVWLTTCCKVLHIGVVRFPNHVVMQLLTLVPTFPLCKVVRNTKLNTKWGTLLHHMHKRLLLPFQVYLSLLIWGPLTAFSHHYLPSPLLSFAWGHLTLAFRPQVFSLIGWLALVSATSLCIMLLSSSVAGFLRSCELWFSSCRGISAGWLLWKCCSDPALLFTPHFFLPW